MQVAYSATYQVVLLHLVSSKEKEIVSYFRVITLKRGWLKKKGKCLWNIYVCESRKVVQLKGELDHLDGGIQSECSQEAVKRGYDPTLYNPSQTDPTGNRGAVRLLPRLRVFSPAIYPLSSLQFSVFLNKQSPSFNSLLYHKCYLALTAVIVSLPVTNVTKRGKRGLWCFSK